MKNITKTITLVVLFIVFVLCLICFKQWTSTVNHIKVVKPTTGLVENNFPEGFPSYNVWGSSKDKRDFLVTPHTTNYEDGFIFIMDYKGKLKRSKRLNSYAYSFRNILGEDGNIYYAYQQVEESTPRSYGALEATHIVLMDENLNEIDNNIKLLKYGGIPYDGYPNENHEYEVLGKNHYILAAAIETTVENIPGHEGESYYVFNNVIQAQKDGKVIWQRESIDYPELYNLWIDSDRESYDTKDSGTDEEKYSVADYAHINAFEYTDDHKLLISFRNIGLVKVDLNTNKIIWVMSRKRNDIKGLNLEDVGLYQHDVEILDDGSFTIFDNSGSDTDNSRIVRYWVDDKKKELIDVKIYKSTRPKSKFMGSAYLADELTDTYDISYGGNMSDIAFEEFDFQNNKQLMWMRFDDGYDLYSIERGL